MLITKYGNIIDVYEKKPYSKDMKKIKSRTTKEYSFTVLYEPVSEGGYQVTVPLLSGVVTYGRTFDEARVMARDAIQCTVEALTKEHERIPNEQALLQERMVVAV